MSLQVWLPLNQGPKNVITDISNFGKEGGITITADTNGWYKIADSSHTSSRWGIYKDFYVKSNTTYTLNVYAKSTTGVAVNVGIQSFNGYTSWPAQRETYSGSSEKLITFTWTTAATDNYARVYLAMNPGSTVANNYVFYKGVEILEAPEIKNQGLADVGAVNNGATYSSTGGKIGSCYSFNGSNSRIAINNVVVPSDSGSICCWFNASDVESADRYIIALNTSGGYADQHFALYQYGAGVQFLVGGTAIYSTTISANTWYHMCITREGTTAKAYINGIQVGASTGGSVTGTNFCIGARCSSANGANIGAIYYFKGKINDVRVYSNTLSAKEVKKISQGLICHYPLTNQYIESTTNLVTTEDGLSNTCYNGATSKYGYGTNTDMYKTLGTFEGRKSTKVYMGTAGLSAYPYVYFDNFNAAGTTIQTLSFYYFPTLQNTIIPYSYNGSYNFSYKTDKASGSATNVSQIIIPVDVGRWNYITITAQKYDTTNTSRGIGYIRIGSTSHTSTTSNYWLFNNVQVEAKDHATGYAGVGGTRTSTFIYDSSGFENHGTISGTLTISTDTPKYKYSVQMPTAATISHINCLDNTQQEWSCAAWVKPTTAGNYQNLNNFNSNNRLYHGTYPLLYLNAGTNDYYNYGNLALPVNEWSHIVFVFKNSTGTKLIYVNGVDHTNMGGPNKTSTPLGIPNIVVIGGSYEGGICDYREYATALSAEDVLALYNNKNF